MIVRPFLIGTKTLEDQYGRIVYPDVYLFVEKKSLQSESCLDPFVSRRKYFHIFHVTHTFVCNNRWRRPERAGWPTATARHAARAANLR